MRAEYLPWSGPAFANAEGVTIKTNAAAATSGARPAATSPSVTRMPHGLNTGTGTVQPLDLAQAFGEAVHLDLGGRGCCVYVSIAAALRFVRADRRS